MAEVIKLERFEVCWKLVDKFYGIRYETFFSIAVNVRKGRSHKDAPLEAL
ncbi:MAG: hypothetical protein ACTS4V_01405 [Candidatus Hodgkinia cicadicola]